MKEFYANTIIHNPKLILGRTMTAKQSYSKSDLFQTLQINLILQNIKSLTIIILVSILTSCSSIQEKKDKLIVQKWIGKEILFPHSIVKFDSKDSLFYTYSTTQNKYKILLYVDTAGCISCKLKLYEWQGFIKKAYTEFGDKLTFEFFFHPTKKLDIRKLLKSYEFSYPVYIDYADSLNKLNDFPKEIKYQCFLLDSNNKVLLIGNPNFIPDLWNSYRQIINKTSKIPTIKTTKIQFDNSTIELKDLLVSDTIYVNAIIKNTGNNPLIIKNIYTDCDCIVPSWSKTPIMPQRNEKITIKITTRSAGYLYKKINILCNTKNKVEQLIIKGFVSDEKKQ